MPEFWRGATPLVACRYDQRFSYCLYVPDQFERLCVYVHGTGREATNARDQLADFAVRQRCLILAPLFPGGIGDPDDLDNYKGIAYRDIRFDAVLLAMVDEVAARYGLDAGRFLLCGFSGGAQFVHRFLYLHPQRLAAVALAAPGRVTLPDDTYDWPVGTRGFEAVFGQAIQLDAMQSVPVHLLVGSLDDDEGETRITESSPYWRPDANAAGTTRIARLQALQRALAGECVLASFELVPGVGHMLEPLLERMTVFFARHISGESR